MKGGKFLKAVSHEAHDVLAHKKGGKLSLSKIAFILGMSDLFYYGDLWLNKMLALSPDNFVKIAPYVAGVFGALGAVLSLFASGAQYLSGRFGGISDVIPTSVSNVIVNNEQLDVHDTNL